MLLDFFPASAGRRAAAFSVGDQFPAELIFYPGSIAERAFIGRRDASLNIRDRLDWQQHIETATDPLQTHAEQLLLQPWRLQSPVLLGAGHFAVDDSGNHWWQPTPGSQAEQSAIPIANKEIPTALYGVDLSACIVLWDGYQAQLLSCLSPWGLEAIDD